MSDEARFSYTTKDRAGNLLTVRGDSPQEFLANLTSLEGFHMQALADLTADANATPALAAVVTAMPGAQIVQEQQLPNTPACKDCGAPTRYEEWIGKNGKAAGREFKAYKCTVDKDHRPEWVN